MIRFISTDGRPFFDRRTRRFAMGVVTGAVIMGAIIGLSGCGNGDDAKSDAAPTEIDFAILSAESQASAGPLWAPLLDDMSKAIGVPVNPFFTSNYTILVEAMKGDQVQVAWLSAKPSIEAIDRADAEVIARTVDKSGSDSYRSTLIVKAGSGITLKDVTDCRKRFDFGIGDALSTSGTLAPMAFLFNAHTPPIDPAQCFKTVRSANHQANAFAVATGVVDVATSNTVNTVFLIRENPQIASQIQEIWQSPPIPESGIVLRSNLDPAIKEKIRSFFLTYGVGDGVEADRQRQVLAGLNYSRFRAADNSYLNPVREMVADQQLSEARKSGDAAAVTAAEAELQRLRSLREVQP